MFRIVAVLYVCSLWFVACAASAHEFLVIEPRGLSAANTAVLADLRAQIQAELPQDQIGLISPADAVNAQDKIAIVAGEEALGEVFASTGSNTIIACFISRASFDRVKMAFPNTKQHVTAIYSDPSPRRQIALIKALTGVSSAGIISTPQASAETEDAKAAAESLGMTLYVANLERGHGKREVFKALAAAQTILLQRDQSVFDVLPLDQLIAQAYDINNKAVVGFSSGLVARNGAMATTFASTSDTAKSIAYTLREIARGRPLPSPGYPRFYSVAVNKYVMRSLGYRDKDENTAKREVAAMLGEGL